MLISKRRLQWSAITLLIMCLLLLFRPTRNWIDRILVAQLVSPSVTVGELVVLRSKSIVEARELRWSGTQGDRSIQFSAQRGWFAFDKLGLVDRHARLPKVILQDANLRLAGATPAPPAQLDLWKQRIAQQITQLDWERIKHQLSCLIAMGDLKKTWSDNIERWVARSQQIVSEAEELERQSVELDNPLRFEVLIQEKLERLKKLSSEQGQLSSQFDELDKQLESESKRLRELQRQDHLQLVGLVIGNAAVEELQFEREQISKELTEELGRALWARIAPYGEVVDYLANASQRAHQRPSYDINIRSNRHGNEWLQLSQWKVLGKFNYGDLQSLFEASGSWALTHEPLFPSNLDFDWRASFHRNHAQVDVHIEHSSQQTETSQLDLRINKKTFKPHALVTLQPLDLQAEAGATGAHARLTSQAGKLRGEFTIQPEALDCIESATLAPWLQLASQPHAEALRFDIEGQWTGVKLDLIGATPAWLSQAVASEAEARIQIASEAARHQLDHAFARELMQLEQLVTTALSDSKTLTANHGRQLLVAQDRLQQQLADRDGTEFARRPGAMTR